MTRSITRTLPLLSILFVFLLSSCSDTMYSGNRHYGNRMYVKVDKNKTTDDRKESKSSFNETQRTPDEITAVPQRRNERIGGDNAERVSPLRKMGERFASILPHAKKETTNTTSPARMQTSYHNAPQIVNAVNISKETADVDTGDITNVLVILGFILIILAIITLILEVAPAGWIGLLIAGLLIILLAYLLF